MRIFTRLLPNRVKVKLDYNKKLKKTGLKDLLDKNKELIGSRTGERCFILGNGPSLKNEKLELLKNETVFCVNDIYAADFYGILQPSYHLFFDPAYYKKADELISIINGKTQKPPAIITGSKERINTDNVANKIIYLSSGFDIDQLNNIGLHIDGLLPYYCTVVQYALSTAISMGFSEIYLLGCDCTGILNHIQKKRGLTEKDYCYDVKSAVSLDNISVMTNEHAFYEWHHIFKSYRILSEYAQKKGIKIIDLTCEGILDVFPKDRIERVLGDN